MPNPNFKKRLKKISSTSNHLDLNIQSPPLPSRSQRRKAKKEAAHVQDQIAALQLFGVAHGNFQRAPKYALETVLFVLCCFAIFPHAAAKKENEEPRQFDNHEKEARALVDSSTAVIADSRPKLSVQQRQQGLPISNWPLSKAPTSTRGSLLKMDVEKQLDAIPAKMNSSSSIVAGDSSENLTEKRRQSIENSKVYAKSISLLRQPNLAINLKEQHCALALIGYEVYGNRWEPILQFCTSFLYQQHKLEKANINVKFDSAEYDPFHPTFNSLMPYYDKKGDYNSTQFLGQIIAYFRTHFSPKGRNAVLVRDEIVKHYISMVQAWFRLEKSATFADAKPVLYLWSTLLHLEFSLDEETKYRIIKFYRPSLVALQQKFPAYSIPLSLVISPNANNPRHLALFKEAFSWSPVLEVMASDTPFCEEMCTVIAKGVFLFNYFDQIEKFNQDPHFDLHDRFPYRTSKMALQRCADVFKNYYQDTRVSTRKSDKDTHLALFVYLSNLIYGDKSLPQKQFDGSLLKYPFIALEEWLDFELISPSKDVKLQIQAMNYIENFFIFYDKNFSRYPVASRKDIAIKLAKLKSLYEPSQSQPMTITALLITSVSILTTLGLLWKRKQNQKAVFEAANEEAQKRPRSSNLPKPPKMAREEKSLESSINSDDPHQKMKLKSLLNAIDSNINKINDCIDLIKGNSAYDKKMTYLAKQKELLLFLQARVKITYYLAKLKEILLPLQPGLIEIWGGSLPETILEQGRKDFDRQKVEDSYFETIEKERQSANNHIQSLAEKATPLVTQSLLPQKGISEATLARNALIWRQQQEAAARRALNRSGLFSPQRERAKSMQTPPAASSSNASGVPISLQNTRAITKGRTVAFTLEDERYLKAAMDSLERLYNYRTIVLTQDKLGNKARYGILYNLMRFHHVIGILQKRRGFSWPFEEREALSIRNTIRHGHFFNYDEGLSSYILALHNSFYNDLLEAKKNLLETKKKLSISIGTLPLPTVKPYGQGEGIVDKICAYEADPDALASDISKCLKIIGELFVESEKDEIAFKENELLHCSLKMLISIIGKNLSLLKKMHVSYDALIPEWKFFDSTERDTVLRAKKYSNYVGHHFDEIGEEKRQQGYSETNEAGGNFLYEYEEITVDQLRAFAILIARKLNNYEPPEAASSSAPSF